MSLYPYLLPCFTFIVFFIVAQATVPPSKTFKFVNEGPYGEYEDEYGSNYRLLPNIQTSVFALCFYNTTPSAYTPGLRMGGRPEDFNIFRWVWAANRENLVGEKATLTFGSNGNLVLAHANGKVAWQTGTANKGVVRLELLPNGNLVLVDNRGRFVWQSFDYPTDSLLVGQGIRVGGTTELVSRVSAKDGSKGSYGFFFDTERLVLYLKSKNSPNTLWYYTSDYFIDTTINQVVFTSVPQTEEAFAYDLSYDILLMDMDNSTSSTSIGLARPKYNSTLSFLRLESDGNIRIHTFYDKVIFGSWDVTYTMYDRDSSLFSECLLPTKCGSLGVCMNNQCVGCPTPNGLAWWNESCAPPKLPVCNKGASVNAKYFKVDGVEHFSGDLNEGEILKLNECRAKCTADCGCLGFFYREESSRCFLAYELGPLSKVSNPSHVAYIKM